jgi:putative transposase
LKFKGIETVNLWTLDGRVTIPMVFGEYQANRLGRLKGQVDLAYRQGKFYLHATIDLPEDPLIEVRAAIGVDFGVVNLAVDSEGHKFSGDAVEKVRRRYGAHRKALQSRGTKSAKRRLGKIRKREANFRRNESHIIAKAIVATAKDTGSMIAVEELAGIIGDGQRFRQEQRSRMKGWAFHQLRNFLEYKSQLAGIPVISVPAAYTSRTCSRCGYCDKKNRKTRDLFECKRCGLAMDADHNAAINIRDRATAAVSRPIAGIVDVGPRNPAEITCKPTGSPVGI